MEEGPRIEFHVCVYVGIMESALENMVPPLLVVRSGRLHSCPAPASLPTSPASEEELTQDMAILWSTCYKIAASQGQLDSSHF